MTTISSVIFSGSQRNPTVTITGSGFGTAPAAPATSPDGGGTGSNYGKSLYISDLSQVFSAGLTTQTNTDYIGLTDLSYSDTSISFQFGSAYSQYLFNFKPGDDIGVGVNGAQNYAPATFAPAITTETIGVARFFETTNGTHFFTADPGEVKQVLSTRPDLKQESSGLTAIDPASNDPAAIPVYRFFDSVYGTQFFTSSLTERNMVTASRPDLKSEGIAFYEHAAQQAGDQAVYRFFDTKFGTHFYVSDAGENTSILATRPDLKPEGIAFYAPT